MKLLQNLTRGLVLALQIDKRDKMFTPTYSTLLLLKESIMNESNIGRVYFDILGSIKDQVANNLNTTCLELKLEPEMIRKIIFVAQATVDGTGSNALPALMKSCK